MFSFLRSSVCLFSLFVLASLMAKDAIVLSEAIPESSLRQGHFWTPDEANLEMKGFARTWNDRASW